jgi:adenylate cyclase
MSMRRIPYFVIIVTVVMAIVVIGMGVQATLGFLAARALEDVAAEAQMGQVRATSTAFLAERVRAAGLALRLLARDPRIAEADGPADALETALAGRLRDILAAFPTATAAYVGFSSGSFVYGADMARVDLSARERLEPPDGAAEAVRVISRAPGAPALSRWRFLDARGAALATVGVADETFDPRRRPWFAAALGHDEAVMTGPYRFAASREIGISFSAASPDGHVVVGIDLTVGQLSEMMTRQKVTPSTINLIVLDDGALIAHSDPAVLPSGTAGSDRVPRLADLDDPASRALAAIARNGTGVPLSVDIDGRSFLAIAQPIALGVGRSATMIVAAPHDELNGRTARLRRDALLLSLATIALGVAIVVVFARGVSRPVRDLVAQADQIARFDFSAPARVATRIAELADLAEAFGRMRAVLEGFGRYVPKQLVRRIVRKQREVRIGGTRRAVTIMFSDIEGYTAFSETIGPEELMAVTSDYFELVTAAVEEHKGIVDKFIGDAVMALWNAPDLDPDHVANACAAALQSLAAIAAFNAQRSARGERALTTRIGLNTGDGVVGNVGAADRLNYTVVGPVVNLASRLEGLNKRYGTHILVSAAVRDAAADRFVFRAIDEVAPAGVSEPVQVYELLAAAATDAGTPELAARRDLAARWEEAHALYRAGRFEAARAQFARLRNDYPGDVPSQIFAARCRERGGASATGQA